MTFDEHVALDIMRSTGSMLYGYIPSSTRRSLLRKGWAVFIKLERTMDITAAGRLALKEEDALRREAKAVFARHRSARGRL